MRRLIWTIRWTIIMLTTEPEAAPTTNEAGFARWSRVDGVFVRVA